MDWRLVAALAPVGVLVGVLSLFGLWPAWFEPIIWAVACIVWVALLYRFDAKPPFWTGAAVGFAGGFSAILCQLAFLDTYLENNPGIAASFVGSERGEVFVVMLVTGFVLSAAYASVVGFATWTAARVRRGQESPPA